MINFNYKYKKIPVDLKEGDSVKIFGQVTLYENTGSYHILVSHLEKEMNLGKLFEELEKLKNIKNQDQYRQSVKKRKRTLVVLSMKRGTHFR